MLNVTIYQPSGSCVKCHATKKAFDAEGIEYTTVTADEEEIERLRREGHTMFPVVVASFSDGVTLQWSDFRLGRIKELAKLI